MPERPAMPQFDMAMPQRPEMPQVDMAMPQRPAMPQFDMAMPERPQMPQHEVIDAAASGDAADGSRQLLWSGCASGGLQAPRPLRLVR